MENRFKKTDNGCAKRGNIILGIIFGLISAGFYVTPFMFFIMGAASLSVLTALQGILFKQFGFYFMLLGILLAMTAILIYLRNKGVKKLTLAAVKPYHAYIGGLMLAMFITYAVLATLALFNFSKLNV